MRLYVSQFNVRLRPSIARHQWQHRRQKTKYKRAKKLPQLEICVFATSKSQSDTYTSGSDGIAFIMDCSATGAICNERSMFAGRFTPTLVTLITAEGTKQHTKIVGTLPTIFTTDEGAFHSYDIPVPGVVHDPDLYQNLIGIPFLANHFATQNESHDNGT